MISNKTRNRLPKIYWSTQNKLTEWFQIMLLNQSYYFQIIPNTAIAYMAPFSNFHAKPYNSPNLAIQKQIHIFLDNFHIHIDHRPSWLTCSTDQWPFYTNKLKLKN